MTNLARFKCKKIIKRVLGTLQYLLRQHTHHSTRLIKTLPQRISFFLVVLIFSELQQFENTMVLD